MNIANAGARACDHSGDIIDLKVRVGALEHTVQEVKASIKRVEDNSDEILSALKFGNTVVGFARRHGGAILAFAIGAGFMNENLATLIRSLLGA